METEMLRLRSENELLKQELKMAAQKVAELEERISAKNIEYTALSSQYSRLPAKDVNLHWFEPQIYKKLTENYSEIEELKDKVNVANKLNADLNHSVQQLKGENARLVEEQHAIGKTILLQDELSKVKEVVELMVKDLSNGFGVLEFFKEECKCIWKECKSMKEDLIRMAREMSKTLRATNEKLCACQEEEKELDKRMKEKANEVLVRDEEKREAIRQLSITLEYHRENCNYLRRKFLEKRGSGGCAPLRL